MCLRSFQVDMEAEYVNLKINLKAHNEQKGLILLDCCKLSYNNCYRGDVHMALVHAYLQ
jgi:hypothetical protein